MVVLAVIYATEDAQTLIIALSAHSATPQMSQTHGNHPGPSADARTQTGTPMATHAKKMMTSPGVVQTVISATSLGHLMTRTVGTHQMLSADVFLSSIATTLPTEITSAITLTTAPAAATAVAAAGPGHLMTHSETSQLMPCAGVQMIRPFFSENVISRPSKFHNMIRYFNK